MITYLFKCMVGLNGIGPSTSPLSGVRSNQLSYRPIYVLTVIFNQYELSVWALRKEGLNR